MAAFQISTLTLLAVICIQFCTGVKYLGCYMDDELVRDFPYSQNLTSTNSVQNCVNVCTAKAYKYAGLQEEICYCGDHYGKYCKVDDSLCDTQCGQTNTQSCGSKGKNSVYTTRYMGCWRDSGMRALTAELRMGATATIETCLSHCSTRGYKYAGAQFYNVCYCGNSYGIYPEVDRSACGTTCQGNAAQQCGGSWANSIYDTGLECDCQQR